MNIFFKIVNCKNLLDDIFCVIVVANVVFL